MHYKVLHGNPASLEADIEYHLSEGYQPIGGIVNFNNTLAQAVVMPDDRRRTDRRVADRRKGDRRK